jgi:hypothetical protein
MVSWSERGGCGVERAVVGAGDVGERAVVVVSVLGTVRGGSGSRCLLVLRPARCAHCPILLRPRDNPRCLPLPFFLSDDGYTHGSSRQRGDGLLPSAHHKLCHARAHSELKLDVRFRMVCWLPRHSKPSKSSDANATVIIDEGVSPMAISKLARARHVT